MESIAIVDNNSTMPVKQDFVSRPGRADLLVRDGNTGKIHFLNPTAALIWTCCDGATTVDECVTKLRAQFNAPVTADLARDVRMIVAQLAEIGLVNA